MKKEKFSEKDFKEFQDPKQVMIQIFDIGCSVCGIKEIDYVSVNAPKTIGDAANTILEEQDMSDEELEKALLPVIESWQEVDDYNASIGVPTFCCNTCYYQLINNEINISIEDNEEKE